MLSVLLIDTITPHRPAIRVTCEGWARKGLGYWLVDILDISARRDDQIGDPDAIEHSMTLATMYASSYRKLLDFTCSVHFGDDWEMADTRDIGQLI